MKINTTSLVSPSRSEPAVAGGHSDGSIPHPQASPRPGMDAASSPLPKAPSLRRTRSLPAMALGTPLPAARLDTLFGSCQPARGKVLEKDGALVKRTPIQAQEVEELGEGMGRVKINPSRVVIATAKPLRKLGRAATAPSTSRAAAKALELSEAELHQIASQPPTLLTQEQIEKMQPATPGAQLAQCLNLEALRKRQVEYKWNISRNGSLIVGETHPNHPLTGDMKDKAVRKAEQLYAQGHVTLVGGQPWNTPWERNRFLPESRICGRLYYDEKDRLCIDNDSGRFSEYADRTPSHLANVAALFQELGLHVETEWVQKKPIELVKQARRADATSDTAAASSSAAAVS
nr:XopV/AopV family type III secretion system effector [Xanthomonas translucens]